MLAFKDFLLLKEDAECMLVHISNVISFSIILTLFTHAFNIDRSLNVKGTREYVTGRKSDIIFHTIEDIRLQVKADVPRVV
jgi:hypothetical protein